ncbi:type II toxin-antitoxin system VapC family toxin [Thiomicrospira sp. ALE5]|uniref:type II toxin-antitoxin system tRNA(fMet)-specific endonuclease VapC n=1 Tax=Thiomicrospira sp. ALE5 TaxID=748650 RepID=UPI0008ED2EAF|nr:type II toxin-antitoxin system VapC family toxin [Thiomicrospira sp. ALE5]SFR52105.1 tRNA(fMet)-specific endonuclease VapC [Thiomicrospira sp. ALE5]
MIYLLDTNIVSYIIKAQDVKLVDKFELAAKTATLGVSSITTAELYYGVKKKNSQKLKQAVDTFLSPLQVFEFDQSASAIYGDIRSDLESRGLVIGGYDLLIAAHAINLQATLITNNAKEFERVVGLPVENWVQY